MNKKNKSFVKGIIDWNKIQKLYPELTPEHIASLKNHELETLSKHPIKINSILEKPEPITLSRIDYFFRHNQIKGENKKFVLDNIDKIPSKTLKVLIDIHPDFLFDLPALLFNTNKLKINELISQKNLISLLQKHPNPPFHLVNEKYIEHPIFLFEESMEKGDWKTFEKIKDSVATGVEFRLNSYPTNTNLKVLDLLIIYGEKLPHQKFLEYWESVKHDEPSFAGLETILFLPKFHKSSAYIGKVINLLSQYNDFNDFKIEGLVQQKFGSKKIHDILRSLYNNNYDFNKKSKYTGELILPLLAKYSRGVSDIYNVFEWLIHKKADIHLKNKNGQSFLTAISNCSEQETFLLKRINQLLLDRKIFPKEPEYFLKLYKDMPQESKKWQKLDEKQWFDVIQPLLNKKKKVPLALKLEIEKYHLNQVAINVNLPKRRNIL